MLIKKLLLSAWNYGYNHHGRQISRRCHLLCRFKYFQYYFKEHPQEESTPSIELQIRSITFMSTFAFWEAVLPDSPNKQPTKSDTLLTHIQSNKENYLMSSLPPECSKNLTTKNNLKQVTSLQVGIHTKALKYFQSIWEAPLFKEISQWVVQGQVSSTDIAMPITSQTWPLKKPRVSASAPFHWQWRETAAQEVSSDWQISLKKESKKNITLMKVSLTSHSDPTMMICGFCIIE